MLSEMFLIHGKIQAAKTNMMKLMFAFFVTIGNILVQKLSHHVE